MRGIVVHRENIAASPVRTHRASLWFRSAPLAIFPPSGRISRRQEHSLGNSRTAGHSLGRTRPLLLLYWPHLDQHAPWCCPDAAVPRSAHVVAGSAEREVLRAWLNAPVHPGWNSHEGRALQARVPSMFSASIRAPCPGPGHVRRDAAGAVPDGSPLAPVENRRDNELRLSFS